MWSSTGRSGYGNSTIGGDYDSWDGISPNGRQYKNEATMETRDLSGADYWHLRKQNRPTEAVPESLHMLKNGKANIEAYADPEPTKRASSIPLVDKILPQAKRIRVLTEQMQQLVQEYKDGIHTPQEYTMLLDILVSKRDRAIELLNKAKNVKPRRDEDDATHVEEEQENVDLAVENPLKQPQKKLENHAFFGACVILALVMLILSH